MVICTLMEHENQRQKLDRMYAQLIEAQPWIKFVREALADKGWSPPFDQAVLIASDYSGQHPKSRFVTYAFIVTNELNWDWDRARSLFRKHCIPDNRRLSFKSFGKTNNLMALAHFLDITKLMTGRLLVFAFEKQLLSQMPSIRPDNTAFTLEARWKPLALEEATRKALLVALLADRYVPEKQSMTWISDEDPSLGNALMWLDVQRMAATLSGVFSATERGWFGMGTTGQDCKHMYREDLVSVADFAAGMVAEISTHLAIRPFVNSDPIPIKYANYQQISEKTQLISEWFWKAKSNFERTCFLVHGTKNKGKVEELYL